jgi:nucleotide-binding universal stress UspA family protein
VAADEARRRRAQLKVVHAMGFLETEARYILQLATPSVADSTRVREIACRELREAISGIGVEAQCDVLEGRPAAAVVREAEAIGAELIVVGARGGTGISRVLLGSVAERIVRHASSAVLVVRSRHRS